ncbi:MAG: hypothetical protein KDI46_04175 [Alphaproteobacteria bacterium]|nr:hypothetical protein [Alphaproteobacteria bacterium]
MLENTDRLLNRIRQNLQQTLIILGDRIDPLTTPPESLHRSTKLKARPNLLKAFTGTVSYTVSRCETTADMDEECQPIGLVEGREAAIRVLQEAALQKAWRLSLQSDNFDDRFNRFLAHLQEDAREIGDDKNVVLLPIDPIALVRLAENHGQPSVLVQDSLS